MPVLLKTENTTVYPTVDVEALVNEVRERLCLKSREKLCSNRRSAPYHRSRHSPVCEHFDCKHYSSPDLNVYSCRHRPQSSCTTYSCGKKLSSKLRDNQTFENPRDLLEKLLSEQSLIQEAVRRLQSQTTRTQTSTCTSRKFFPFVDDDSCDRFSNQTPLYSESEDDCFSNSVDS